MADGDEGAQKTEGAQPRGAGLGGGLAGVGTGMVGESVAFALGFALGRVLEPVGTKLRQEAWAAAGAQLRALSAEEVGQMVAKYVKDYSDPQGNIEAPAYAEAAQTGVSHGRLQKLAYLASAPPGTGELIELLQRGAVTGGDAAQGKPGLHDGFRQHKLRREWWAPMAELAITHLSADEVATAVQRGVIRDFGALPVDPPLGGDHVKTHPPSALDALEEAAKSGVSRERLAVRVRLVGLPPGPHELLDLLNRKTITEKDYRLGVAQGNLKNEWADSLLALRRRLLSPHESAELYLRGWIGKERRDDIAALSGMHADDTELLFKMLGRPLVAHQITTGLARGGKFGGGYDVVPEPYRTAIRQSNIRPEWADLDYHNRYNLPSAFVIRSLVQSGGLTADDAETLFLHTGWPPYLAKKVAKNLAKGVPSRVKQQTVSHVVTEYEGGYISRGDLIARLENLGYTPGVAKDYAVYADALRATSARNSRLSRIRSQFVAHALSDLEVKQYLDELKLAPELHDRLLSEWRGEREANIRTLTPAQLKKAYQGNIYTLPQTIHLLERMGYSETDAYVLLELKPPSGIH